jgi:hypothetical protein
MLCLETKGIIELFTPIHKEIRMNGEKTLRTISHHHYVNYNCFSYLHLMCVCFNHTSNVLIRLIVVLLDMRLSLVQAEPPGAGRTTFLWCG